MKPHFSLFTFAFSLLLLASCADTLTTVSDYKGGRPIGSVHEKRVLWGQENYSNSAFGIIDTSNLDIGFQQFTNMMTTLVAAYAAADVAKAREVTTQLANSGATQQQLAQINAQAAATAQSLSNDASKTLQGTQLTHFQTAVGANRFTPVPLPTATH